MASERCSFCQEILRPSRGTLPAALFRVEVKDHEDACLQNPSNSPWRLEESSVQARPRCVRETPASPRGWNEDMISQEQEGEVCKRAAATSPPSASPIHKTIEIDPPKINIHVETQQTWTLRKLEGPSQRHDQMRMFEQDIMSGRWPPERTLMRQGSFQQRFLASNAFTATSRTSQSFAGSEAFSYSANSFRAD